MSAGLGTPVITFTSWPVSYADTVESVQLDTRIRVPVTTTPSKPPAPLAMTRGARSPGFHASTDLVGPNETMMNRLPTGSTVIPFGDRKSTRLNSSHSQISYAVFCLKKKKQISQHKC